MGGPSPAVNAPSRRTSIHNGYDAVLVVLSHLHLDHTAGLYGIIGRRLQQHIPGVLRIYGPPGARRVVEGITTSQSYVDSLLKTDSASGGLAPTTVVTTEITDGSASPLEPRK